MKPLNNTYYLAFTYNIPKEALRAYSQYLHTVVLPVYDELKHSGITGYEIYRHRITTEQYGKFTVWNTLHLIQLDSRGHAEECLHRLTAIEKFSAAELIRQEVLFSTPESNYPIPATGTRRRWFQPLQIVEYVDVAADALDEFREIMIHGNGPAMRYILEERNWCQSFTALETTNILYHNDRYPGWNQIHVIALHLEAPFLYKKDFNEGLRRSSGNSFKQNFSRLEEIRHMLYKSVSVRQKGR
ncbi:hypothetical protein [Paenibacillus camerounensis]|uniref:hypothetical protein n=1 Tax=Paenibacillus camerounensis TaxID=1243663 RepID=UPI0005AA332F|nr:hypothetical protein [Paenibacillus camerounensis]